MYVVRIKYSCKLFQLCIDRFICNHCGNDELSIIAHRRFACVHVCVCLCPLSGYNQHQRRLTICNDHFVETNANFKGKRVGIHRMLPLLVWIAMLNLFYGLKRIAAQLFCIRFDGVRHFDNSSRFFSNRFLN